MYSMLSIKNLNIEGGIFSINKDSNTFLRILFYLERQNKGISIEANKKTKPSHQFTLEDYIYSQSLDDVVDIEDSVEIIEGHVHLVMLQQHLFSMHSL